MCHLLVLCHSDRVSSFIARTLNAAQSSEWSEEVFIPIELLNKITMWIAKQQNTTDGHFEDSAGVIYDRTMQVCIRPI